MGSFPYSQCSLCAVNGLSKVRQSNLGGNQVPVRVASGTSLGVRRRRSRRPGAGEWPIIGRPLNRRPDDSLGWHRSSDESMNATSQRGRGSGSGTGATLRTTRQTARFARRDTIVNGALMLSASGRPGGLGTSSSQQPICAGTRAFEVHSPTRARSDFVPYCPFDGARSALCTDGFVNLRADRGRDERNPAFRTECRAADKAQPAQRTTNTVNA